MVIKVVQIDCVLGECLSQYVDSIHDTIQSCKNTKSCYKIRMLLGTELDLKFV